jgi:carboxylesterase type B
MAWAQFAATGTPGGPGLPAWPAAAADEPLVMVLDSAPRVEVMERLSALRLLAQPIIARPFLWQ